MVTYSLVIDILYSCFFTQCKINFFYDVKSLLIVINIKKKCQPYNLFVWFNNLDFRKTVPIIIFFS